MKMKIKLAIIYHIFRPCVKNLSKAAVQHKLKRVCRDRGAKTGRTRVAPEQAKLQIRVSDQ